VTSGFALPMLRPMVAMDAPLGGAVIVIVFAVAAVMMAVTGILLGDNGIALAFAQLWQRWQHL
jgi:hypothetical protein